jgi:hypothetical protein
LKRNISYRFAFFLFFFPFPFFPLLTTPLLHSLPSTTLLLSPPPPLVFITFTSIDTHLHCPHRFSPRHYTNSTTHLSPHTNSPNKQAQQKQGRHLPKALLRLCGQPKTSRTSDNDHQLPAGIRPLLSRPPPPFFTSVESTPSSVDRLLPS